MNQMNHSNGIKRMSSLEEKTKEKTNDNELNENNRRNVKILVKKNLWLDWWHSLMASIHRISVSLLLIRCHHYLSSLRPWSFSASLTPVLIGSVLAHKTTEQFSFLTLLATLLTVVSVHAAGNLVNTYCDFIKGIDSKRRSDDRTLVDCILTPEEVVNLGDYYLL